MEPIRSEALTLKAGCGAVRGLALALGLLACNAAVSADATDPPELVAAKGRAELAKAEAEYAKAQAELFKSRLGDLSGDLVPKGTIEAKTLNVEGQVRAYETVAKAATTIATRVRAKVCTGADDAPKCPPVVLVTDAEMQLLARYRAFVPTAEMLLSRAPDLVKSAREFAPPDSCATKSVSFTAASVPPLTAISAVLGIAGLFKSDRAFEGATVTVDTFALNTLLLRELGARHITAIYLPTRLLQSTPALARDSAQAFTSPVLRKYEQLTEGTVALVAAADAYDSRKALLAKTLPVGKGLCKNEWDSAVAVGDQNAAHARTLGNAIQEFLTSLSKTDEATGRSAIINFVIAEQIEPTLRNAHFLSAKSVAAGGTVQTKKNALSSHIYVGGASVVSFLMTDEMGSPELSDTIAETAGFEEIR